MALHPRGEGWGPRIHPPDVWRRWEGASPPTLMDPSRPRLRPLPCPSWAVPPLPGATPGGRAIPYLTARLGGDGPEHQAQRSIRSDRDRCRECNAGKLPLRRGVFSPGPNRPDPSPSPTARPLARAAALAHRPVAAGDGKEKFARPLHQGAHSHHGIRRQKQPMNRLSTGQTAAPAGAGPGALSTFFNWVSGDF